MTYQGSLIFDSEQARGLAGVRGRRTGERAMLFRVRHLSVDVVVATGDDSLQVVHGQILDERHGRPLAAARVHLGDEHESVVTDEQGHFSVSALLRDDEQYLTIETPERQLICMLPAHGTDE